MKDRLEKYLESQRYSLDIEDPDDERIWKNISAEMDRHHRFRGRILRIAASLLILLTAGITTLYVMKLRHPGYDDPVMYRLPGDLAGEEQLFRQVILLKMDQVRKAASGRGNYTEMMNQLGLIDRQYETYMTDLRELGAQPRILRGIIRCYEMKIRVIEKTLNEIEKQKLHEIMAKNPII